MKRLAISLSAGLIALATVSSPSYAQGNEGHGSIPIYKDRLEKVRWYKSPLELQILDDGPAIRDFRTRPQQPNVINLHLAPLEAAPGKVYEYGDPNAGGGAAGAIPLTPISNGLPSAGFGSNIPKNSHVNPNLPFGGSVPIVGMAPTTPPTSAVAQKAVSGHLSPARKTPAETPVRGYKPYNQAGGAGLSSAPLSTKTDAYGKLIGHPMLSRLPVSAK